MSVYYVGPYSLLPSRSKATDCRRISTLIMFKSDLNITLDLVYDSCSPSCCSRRVLNEDLRLRRRHCGLGEVEQADAEPENNPRPSGAQQVGVSTNYQLLRYRLLASQSPQRGPSVTSAFTSTPTCRCGRMSIEQCRGASLLFADYARSAMRCRQPHCRYS